MRVTDFDEEHHYFLGKTQDDALALFFLLEVDCFAKMLQKSISSACKTQQ